MISLGSMGLLSYEILLFFVNILLLYLYLKASQRYHWFDKPDESRKLHSTAKPTSAGLVFMLPIIWVFFSFSVFPDINNISVAIGLLVLTILGGIDDFYPISVKIRLFFISLVCLCAMYALFSGNEYLNYYLMFLYFIGFVWWLNLFNFMDGADGMTTLHAMITAIGYIFAFYMFSHAPLTLIITLSLFLICLLSFLVFNFPISKMFMGDSGSLSVAFLLAAFALYGLSHNIFDQTLVASFHLVFIVDTTLTLFTRIKFKHKLSQAHSLHLFQALIHGGLSHAKVSLIYAAATIILVGLAVFLRYQHVDSSTRIVVLILEVVFLSFFWINFHNKTKFAQFLK